MLYAYRLFLKLTERSNSHQPLLSSSLLPSAAAYEESAQEVEDRFTLSATQSFTVSSPSPATWESFGFPLNQQRPESVVLPRQKQSTGNFLCLAAFVNKCVNGAFAWQSFYCYRNNAVDRGDEVRQLICHDKWLLGSLECAKFSSLLRHLSHTLSITGWH